MIIGAQTIGTALIALLAFLLLNFLAGSLLFYVAERRKGHAFFCHSYADIFLRIFWGVIFTSSVYACLITAFKSSLLPIPFLVLIAISKQDKNVEKRAEDSKDFKWRHSLVFCLVLICGYLLHTILHLVSTGTDFNYIGSDFAFYARAADYLNFRGNENVTLDYLNQANYVEPYHYGDLWSAAFVNKASGIKPIIASLLIIYPAFFLLFSLGLLAYLQSVFGNRVKVPAMYLIVLLSGFVSGLIFLYPHFLVQTKEFSIPLIGLPKLFLPACIILALLLSLRSRDWQQSFLIATTGALYFINIGPVLLTSLAMVYIISVFGYKQRVERRYKAIMILCACSFIYYVLFYYFNNTTKTDLVLNRFQVRTAINIVGGGLLQFFPLLPFLLFFCVLFPLKKQSLRSFFFMPADLLFLMTVPFCGLLCWVLFYSVTTEAVQFFSNAFAIVCVISIVLLLVYAFSSSKTFTTLALATTILFVATVPNLRLHLGTEKISRNDYKSLAVFLRNHPNGYFVNLQDLSHFSSILDKKTNVHQPLEFISYLQARYVNISLNSFELDVDPGTEYSRNEKNLLETASFTSFVRRAPKSTSASDYQEAFIRQFGIRYFSVDPRVSLPYFALPMIRDSIRLSAGWRIYYLDPADRGKKPVSPGKP